MKTPRYCKLCLATKIKMLPMNAELIEVYSKLLQLSVRNGQHHICYECSALLIKYNVFYSKCVMAHNILQEIVSDDKMITLKELKSIDREHYKLISKLSPTRIKTFSYHFDLIEDCDGEQIKVFIDEIKHEGVSVNETENTEITMWTKQTVNETNQLVVNEKCNKIDKANRNANNTAMVKRNYFIEDPMTSVEFKKEDDHESVKSFSDCDDEPLSKIPIEEREVSTSDQSVSERKQHLTKKSGAKFNESFFEDYATVILLSSEEAKEEVANRKETSNYIHCPFKCHLCYRGFEVKGTFENHMQKHSLERGAWECEYCHLRFPEKKYLKKHFASSHQRKFICKICPYICFCAHQAKTHISLHQGKKYPCKDCGEIFSMPNSLAMHARRHLAVASLVCADCGRGFRSARGLQAHRLLLHRLETTEYNGPNCEDCGIQFANETAWKRHLVLSTKHAVSNGCEFCGETFSSAGDLKTHLKVHSRKQPQRADRLKLPAACPICGVWLSDREGYAAHASSRHPGAAMRATAAPAVVCELCGKAFKKRCFLVHHKRTHSGERPHECTVCGKRFALPGTLAAHKRTHSGARHRCHVCDKALLSRSALNKHVKAHESTRSHECTICSASFPTVAAARRHARTHQHAPNSTKDTDA